MTIRVSFYSIQIEFNEDVTLLSVEYNILRLIYLH